MLSVIQLLYIKLGYNLSNTNASGILYNSYGRMVRNMLTEPSKFPFHTLGMVEKDKSVLYRSPVYPGLQ